MTDAVNPLGSAHEMLSRLAKQWSVPLMAGIEISDRCNEVCVHCYQEQGRKGEMTTQQLFGVMDELAHMGVLMLTFSGGEATLRRDFLELVAYAREKNFVVRVFTNGLTMTRALAQKLAEYAVQSVEISVYSTRAEMHDFVTGVPGSFERTVTGVRNLVAAGVHVTIKTPVMSINEHEIPAYVAFAERLGASFSVSPSEMMPREGGDRSPEMFEVSQKAHVELLRQFNPAQNVECGVKPERPLDSAPCGAGRGVHIEPNGELRPCTMLEFDTGHALRDGVASAYATNERTRQLRELTWAQLHGCRSCDLRGHCSHCYASARAQMGDALGPYPGGCHSARVTYEARHGRPPQIEGSVSERGPYREIADGVFEIVSDEVTADDDALAARLGWTRRPEGALPAPGPAARPGDLVQIRRPGRKKPQLGRVPTWPNTADDFLASATLESESRSNAS